ncbi:uncharacterized protein LOC128884321 isoform X2 [Hylaeus volcanicus]|uniref:uncharacterized protein LOC128884321 isoform X2 n=1 Tax=Hylaeus volcanicus TaxID=313075 RepID=UPI0023B83552|nr:uncharacterized protein LOC128884321 isoform X2 [Hylaeus volcanicus]
MSTLLSNPSSSMAERNVTEEDKRFLREQLLKPRKFSCHDSPNDFLHQAIRRLKHAPHRILLKLDENKAVIFFVPTQINEILYNIFLCFANQSSITLSENEFKKMIFQCGIIKIKKYPEKLQTVKSSTTKNPPMRQDKITHCIFRHCDNPNGKPIGYEHFLRVLFRLSRYLFRRYRLRDEEMINAVVLALVRSPVIKKMLKNKQTNATRIQLVSASTMTNEKGMTTDFSTRSNHPQTLNNESFDKNVDSLHEKKIVSTIEKVPILKKNVTLKKELILKKDFILKKDLVLKKELISKVDPISKIDPISKVDPISENGLIPKKNRILKKDPTKENDLILKKNLFLKKEFTLKKDHILQKNFTLKKQSGNECTPKLSTLNVEPNQTSPIPSIDSFNSNPTLPIILKKNITSTTPSKYMKIPQTTVDMVKNSNVPPPTMLPLTKQADHLIQKNLNGQQQETPRNTWFSKNTNQTSTVLINHRVTTPKEKETDLKYSNIMFRDTIHSPRAETTSNSVSIASVYEDDVWFDKKMYEIFRLYADNKRGEIPLMTHHGFQGTLLDSGLAESFYFEELFSLYHDVCEEQMLDPEEGITYLDFQTIFKEVGVDFVGYTGRDQHKKKLIYYWIIRNYFIPLLEHYCKTSHETEKFPFHVMDHQHRILQNDNITPVLDILIQEDGTVLDKDGRQLPGPIYSLDDRLFESPFRSNFHNTKTPLRQKSLSCYQNPIISYTENNEAQFSPTVTFKPFSDMKILEQNIKDADNTLTHLHEYNMKPRNVNQETLEINLQNQKNGTQQHPEDLNVTQNVYTTTQDCSPEERSQCFVPQTSVNLVPFNQGNSLDVPNSNRQNFSNKSIEGQNLYYTPTPYVITQKGEVKNTENGDILHGFTAGHNNTILGPDDRPVWNACITPTGHVELLTTVSYIKSSAYLDDFPANWSSDNDNESAYSRSSDDMHNCHVSRNFDCGKRFRMPLPKSLKKKMFSNSSNNSSIPDYIKSEYSQFVQSPHFG